MGTKRFFKFLNLLVIFLMVFSPVTNGVTIVTAQDRAGGVVELDGSVSVLSATSGQNIDVTHTTGSGANRLMLVGISWNSATTATSISSVSFTPSGESAIALEQVIVQKQASNNRYSAIYSLLDPPEGVSGTVRVNLSASISNGIVIGVANFSNVDQADPLGTPGGASSSSNNTTVTLTLGSLTGDELVFDNIFIGGNPPAAVTVGAGQTELTGWNVYSSNTRGAASTEQATSSSVTMSWTAAADSMWVTTAVPINPASAISSVEASAIPSDEAPTEGDTVTVTINIDMTNMLSPDDHLGAFTGSLSWDPGVLSYASDSDLLAGYTGAINLFSDHINFNGVKISGETGSINVLTITFDVIGAGDALLDLSFSVLTADT